MKKIIRLTESDLARIVKRVIMEQSEMIKIKAWDNKEKRDMGAPRTYNFDTTNHYLRNNEVLFDAQITGQMTNPMEFGIYCGETDNTVHVNSSQYRPKPGDILYITDAARKQLTKKCTAYQK
jgi:hypothetical protein